MEYRGFKEEINKSSWFSRGEEKGDRFKREKGKTVVNSGEKGEKTW